MKNIFCLVLAILGLAVLFKASRHRGAPGVAVVPAGAVVWDALPVSRETQADAHLLRFPDGQNILIDAGEVAPLLPMLQNLGIRHLQRILISHPHEDHYNGLRALLNSSIKIDEIDFKVPPEAVCKTEHPWGCNRAVVEKLLAEARAHGIKVGESKAGDIYYDANGTKLECLYVYDGVHTPVGQTDANDMSAILLLTVGKMRALFPGDLNHTLGEYLARQNDPRLAAQLLKVPHHGTESAAPNEFFARVGPQAAIVPAPAELWRSERSRRIREYFEKARVPTYVNGIAGRIEVILSPDSYRIYLPGF